MLNKVVVGGLFLTSYFMSVVTAHAMAEEEDRVTEACAKVYYEETGEVNFDSNGSVSLTGKQIKQIFQHKENFKFIIQRNKIYFTEIKGEEYIQNLLEEKYYGSNFQYKICCFDSKTYKRKDDDYFLFTFCHLYDLSTNNNIGKITIESNPHISHLQQQTTSLILSGQQLKQILLCDTVVKTNKGIIQTNFGPFFVQVLASHPPLIRGIKNNDIFKGILNTSGKFDFWMHSFDTKTQNVNKNTPHYHISLLQEQ